MQRTRQPEVVVEAVLDRRADAELHVGKQVHDGRGHHVRRAVAHGGEAILGPRGERRDSVLADLVSVDGHGPKRSAWPLPRGAGD